MTAATMVRYEAEAPEVFELLEGVEDAISTLDLDPGLHHLVKLRASQMNRCAYCVKMHTTEARRDGETNERLNRLVVWPHVSDFTPTEKAAFAWTEALTNLHEGTDYRALREALREHFSDRQISALTSAIAMINLWNRFQVSRH
jgi:AhpD family alkylhydroperoxidase